MALSFESTTFLTQPDFARWCEERASNDPNRYELLNGRVVMNPPAGWPHGGIESNLSGLLNPLARRAGDGITFGSSQGFEFPSGDTVEPDFSFVSKQRWSAASSPQPGRFLQVVPDLVVEILSTSTSSRDRGEKKAIYERNGVREYWVIDPHAQTVTVFERGASGFGPPPTLTSEDELTVTLLGGFRFAVSELFPSP